MQTWQLRIENSKEELVMYVYVGFTHCKNIKLIYRTRATITRSWTLTIHKARILRKKTLEKTFLDFKKWLKSTYTNRGL